VVARALEDAVRDVNADLRRRVADELALEVRRVERALDRTPRDLDAMRGSGREIRTSPVRSLSARDIAVIATYRGSPTSRRRSVPSGSA